MEKTLEFFNNCAETIFLATNNDGRPSCRPFGTPILVDGKLYSMTHAGKEVAKQLAKNSRVCVVAMNSSEQWIRVECDFVDDSENVEVKKAMIAKFEWAEMAGYTLDNPDFKVFRWDNASSVVHAVEGETIAEEQF